MTEENIDKLKTLQEEYSLYKYNVTDLMDSLFLALEDELSEAYDKADSLEISICEARWELIKQICEEITKLNNTDNINKPKKKREVTPDGLVTTVIKI